MKNNLQSIQSQKARAVRFKKACRANPDLRRLMKEMEAQDAKIAELEIALVNPEVADAKLVEKLESLQSQLSKSEEVINGLESKLKDAELSLYSFKCSVEKLAEQGPASDESEAKKEPEADASDKDSEASKSVEPSSEEPAKVEPEAKKETQSKPSTTKKKK